MVGFPRISRIFVVTCACGAITHHACCQSVTWDGSVNDNFGTPPNWVGNMVPSGAVNGTIFFGAEGGGGNHIINNFNATLSDVFELNFDTADGSYVITGSGSAQIVNDGFIDNDSGFDQILGIDIIATGSRLRFDTDAGTLTLNGNVDLSHSGGVEFSFESLADGIINGNMTGAGGSIRMDRVGRTLFLNGNNTFTGPLNVLRGTVQLNGNLADTISVTLANNASAFFDLNDNDEVIGSLTGGGASGGNVTLGSATLTIQETGTTSYGGIISGTGGLTLNGPGTFSLTGNNTFTGPLTIFSGTLQLDGSIADTAAVTLANTASAVFDLNDDDETIGQLSGGGALGGNVDLGSAVLTINQDTATTYAGSISGSGAVVLNGSGTLNLAGLNTFTGPLSIDDGTLQLDGDIADTVFVAIADAPGAIFDLNGNDETIGSLAGGGASGGNITLGAGTLTVQETGTNTYSGTISGPGGLTLNGPGTLRLAGNSTFTGPLTILNGTLQLNGSINDATAVSIANSAGAVFDLNGSDETIGSLAGGGAFGGNVALGAATLTISEAGTTTYAGLISGTGGLTLNGAGTLTLTGNSTYTGLTDINAGELILNGAVGGSISVGNNAVISGAGTVGNDLTITTGGTLAPGNSIGTLTVLGNYVQQSGSLFNVELDGPTTTSDLLAVTGTATLHAGSQIVADITGESFISSGDLFPILNAAGGVTDLGAIISTTSVTLTFDLIVDPSFSNGDPVFSLLASRAPDTYSSVADTANNFTVGLSLDSLIPQATMAPASDIATLMAQLDTFDLTTINQVYRELTPASIQAADALAISRSTQFNRMLSNHLNNPRGRSALRSALTEPWMAGALASLDTDPRLMQQAIEIADDAARNARTNAIGLGGFLEGISQYDQLDTQPNLIGYIARTRGAHGGIDYRFDDNLLAGISLAYERAEVDFREGRGTLDIDSVRVGPYARFAGDRWSVSGSVSLGINTHESARSIPALGVTASSTFDSLDLTVQSEGRFTLLTRDVWSVAGVLAAQYMHVDFDSYNESGAGGANLSVPSRTADSLLTRIGIALNWQPMRDLDVDFSAGWEHEYFDNDDLTSSFLAGGAPFTIRTGNRVEDSIYYGVGANAQFAPQVSGSLRVEGDAASDGFTVAVIAGVGVTF